MNEEDHTGLNRLRFIALFWRIALWFFAALLLWQLFVLATGSYPEHLQPIVKIFSGTEQLVPVAYAWTIRLALITLTGLFVSLTGSIVIHQRIVIRRAKMPHLTADNALV